MSNKLILNDKTKCCGCFSCENICPKQAIESVSDNSGSLYPKIDLNKCIDCGLCSKVCNYKNQKYYLKPIKGYVAITKNEGILKKSTSGGIFSTIAKKYIQDGWKVCGCIGYFKNEEYIVEHVLTDDYKIIEKMQGSKYVQSSIKKVLIEIKKLLNNGEKILFSGTPCQISALKFFLRKEYKNLITIEIICHGAPSLKLLNDYIKFYNLKNNCTLTDIVFRTKKYGWKNIGYIKYKKNSKNIIKTKDLIFNESSYYYLFEKGYFFRESCYKCSFAGEMRMGDITIGDYWGIEKVHPELLKKININMGTSCLIINSNKGTKIIENCSDLFYLFESSFDNIRKYNKQLNVPTKRPDDLDDIIEQYNKEGYIAIDDFFRKKYKKYYIQKLKNKVKKILRKL